jgi:hypothetical protein
MIVTLKKERNWRSVIEDERRKTIAGEGKTPERSQAPFLSPTEL